MSFEQKLSVVKETFFQFHEADGRNMSKVVSELAGLDGMYQSKVDALTQSIENFLYYDKNGDRPLDSVAIVFKHNKHTIWLTHYDDNYGADTYIHGKFVDCDACVIKVRMITVPEVERDCDVALTASSIKGLAEQIVCALHHNKLCELCGQLLDMDPKFDGTVCRKCGLWELQKPCVGCKRCIGRNVLDNDGEPEHPLCKKRREE